MTGCVVGHAMRKARTDIGNTRNLHEKFREFEGALAESNGFSPQRPGRKQFRIEDAHHGGAGARGANDGFSVLKDAQEALGAGTRIVPEPGIEGGLATAGLVFREADLPADSP